MKKIKVLTVIQLIRKGGVELAAINFSRGLDKNIYDVTFLLIDCYDNQDDILAEKLKSEGFDIVCVPENCRGYFARYKYILSYLKQNHFDIVHSHVQFFSGIVLAAAKKAGVKVRAAHSHAVKWNRKENFGFKIYKDAMRFLLKINCNLKFSCSKEAGEYLYGKKQYDKFGIFVPNGIDINKFAFNSDYRREIRNEFSVTDGEILVGHIGSVYKIKNQVFLVDVFNKMLEKNENLKLVLVGKKYDSKPVEDKINRLGLTDKVILTDQRSDVFKFYSAMDIMIFPSLFEAFPVSLVEAQASCLPCLVSSAVTDGTKQNENVRFMSLNEPAEIWANAAFDLMQKDRFSVSNKNLVDNFDINKVCKTLQKYYSERM